jgi:hypothetical protein
MWGTASSLINSPLSYAADAFNFQYNSSTGGTVNFTNIGLIPYTYSIQMNNFGSPRSTIHSYTDGVVIQSIGGIQVSRMFADGNLILGTSSVNTGHKLTISGDLYVNTIVNAIADTDRFIVSDGGVIKYRTGAEILADIGAQGAITLTTTGTSGPATLISNTLNIPNYGSALTGYVPYTGATQDLNLGTFGLIGDFVRFNPSSSNIPSAEGVMSWDNTDGTVRLSVKGNTYSVPIGQSVISRVRNNTGTNLLRTNYQVVKVAGAQGQRLAVTLAQANNDANSASTLGLVCENISNNQEGFIVNIGQIVNVNTTGNLQGETWLDGDVLYLSPTIAGAITKVKPLAPQHTVIIGYVEYAHANNGKIYVKIDNGYELEELHDVSAEPFINNGLLYRDTTLNLWKSATIDTILGYTPAPQGNYITSLTGEATASGPGAASVTLSNSAVTGKVLTGLNITGNAIVSTDSILTAFGKLQNQVNQLVGGLQYEGTWNASTNTPTITSSVGTDGTFYIVSVAGTTNINGINDWQVGDWIVFHDTVWQKVDNSDSVSSVFGRVGNVVANQADYSAFYPLIADIKNGVLTVQGTGVLSGSGTFSANQATNNTITLTHAAVSRTDTTSAQTPSFGGSFTAIDSVTSSAEGHITAINTKTVTVPSTVATATQTGLLSSTDWSIFNGKQNTITLTTTGTTGPSTFIGNTLNIPNYTPDLSGYVTLGTDQTITGLKTILRGGDVLNFKIGTDTLYGLKVAYNQNELVPSGEATWSFVNTFNRNGSGYETTPISFFRGVLVTGERLLSASINTNLLDYYSNNPSGRYPVYAYNTGVQQFSTGIIVGKTTGVVNAATGAIADLPAGVVANFNGRVIGGNAVNSNEFVTLSQVSGYVPTSRTITINGTTQDLSANRTFNVGTVTSVTASSPLSSSGGSTPNITISQASGSTNGFLSSTDWTTFNNKANANGSNASGTWGINITGSAGSTNTLLAYGGSLVTQAGSGTVIYNYALTAGQAGLFPSGDNSNSIITLNRHPGDYYSQLGFNASGTMFYRSFNATPINTSQGWQTIITSSNYNSYSPTLTGGGASGNWGINITGSAGSVDFNNLTNKTGGTGVYQTSGDFRAPIFYDSNNTAYYVNPAGTSYVSGEFSVQQSSISGLRLISNSGVQSLWVRAGYDTDGSATPVSSPTNIQFQSSGNSGGTFTFVTGNTRALTILGDYAQGSGSLRAPIFYDSNDTGYYVDPNSNSVLVNTFASRYFTLYNNFSDTINNAPWYGLGGSNVGGPSGGLMVQLAGYYGLRLRSNNITFELESPNYSSGWVWSSAPMAVASQIRATEFVDYNDTSYFVNPNGQSTLLLVNAPNGYISNGNPWGTANSAFFPNGITTAGSTNWVYGLTFLGNAPGNGSGAEVRANGSSYFRSSNTSGTWGYAGQFVDRNSAANNYVPWSFENELGNHSWGLVARFHIQTAGQDKPGIQFTSAGSNERWSLGYCSGSDFNFRITQNQGMRTDGSGNNDGWGTERFIINTSGNITAAVDFRAPIFYDSNDTGYYINPNSDARLYALVVGYSTSSAPGVFRVAAGHGDTSIRLTAQGLGSGNSPTMQWWVSEPNVTWDWGGFGYNVTNDGGSPGGFGRVNTSWGQAYMRFSTGGELYFYNTNTSGSRTQSLYLAPGGQATFGTDVRSPIFYDSDNTAYYLNPNGGSYFAGSVEVANGYFLSNGVGGAMYMTAVSGSFGGYLRTSGHMVLDQMNAGYNVYVLDGNSVGVVKNAGSQSWSAFSDATIKTVHSTMEDNLSKLQSITPIYYSFNNFADDKNRIGLIAQEVQEHFPELVEVEPRTEKLTLDYTGLIPVLLGAIKELKKEIDTLKIN